MRARIANASSTTLQNLGALGTGSNAIANTTGQAQVYAQAVFPSAALDGVAVGAVVEAAEPTKTAELVDELVDEIEPAAVVAISLVAETKPVEAAELDETELDVLVAAVGSGAETGIGPA